MKFLLEPLITFLFVEKIPFDSLPSEKVRPSHHLWIYEVPSRFCETLHQETIRGCILLILKDIN